MLFIISAAGGLSEALLGRASANALQQTATTALASETATITWTPSTPSPTPTGTLTITPGTLTPSLSPTGSLTPDTSATSTYTPPPLTPTPPPTVPPPPPALSPTVILPTTSPPPPPLLSGSPAPSATPTPTYLPLPEVTFQYPESTPTFYLLSRQSPTESSGPPKGGGLLLRGRAWLRSIGRAAPIVLVAVLWIGLGVWFVLAQVWANRE